MPDNDRPLCDIRLVDLSEDVAGPFCTKLLAGLGAEVIKVERPDSGDVSRRAGPFSHEAPHAEQSATFLYLNTGKKSITLDYSQPHRSSHPAAPCRMRHPGGEFSPGFLDQLGLGYSAIEPLNPRLIYTSITPFGHSGPYCHYQGAEIVAQALGALMYTIGLPEREPLKIGGNAALYTTGMSAFSATMLALHVRDTAGDGQHVDVSAMETMTVAQIHASIQHQFGRRPGRRASTLVRAQDGWVHPGLERGVRDDTWSRVCA
jgi:crotonobetainyl-CoA:carnitine CoA-transferase CaiB-like acyl-CoA transferase